MIHMYANIYCVYIIFMVLVLLVLIAQFDTVDHFASVSFFAAVTRGFSQSGIKF